MNFKTLEIHHYGICSYWEIYLKFTIKALQVFEINPLNSLYIRDSPSIISFKPQL